MRFELPKAIEILERTPVVLYSLTDGIADDWINQHEGENTWSAFDVIGHLIVCEQTDFMSRIQLALSDNEDKTFAPIDMYAHFESSKGKTMAMLLREFRVLRDSNIQVLKQLQISEADFYKTGLHPKLGQTTVKELLASWTAHDLSHIAQIARVMAKQLKEEVGPFVSLLTILK